MSSPALRAGRRRLLSLSGSLLILSGLLPGAAAAPVLAAPTDLFFSEYVEGSSNNKALEIYNGTGAEITLDGVYSVQLFFNGSAAAGLTIPLVGSIADGNVYVVAQASADPAILAVADLFNNSGWFNGDDAVALFKGTAAVDVIGQIGFDPGTEWGSGLTSTMDNTLRRDGAIQAGDPIGSDAFDPAVQWEGFATDTFDGLGTHSLSPEAAPVVTSTAPQNGATGVPINTTPSVTFNEPVALSSATILCDDQGDKAVSISGGPLTFSLTTLAFQHDDHCTVTIPADAVSDADSDDPPDGMAAAYTWTFDTAAAVTGSPIVINEVDYDQPINPDSTEYLELKNTSDVPVDLDPYTVRLVNGTGGGASVYTTIDLPAVFLAAGDYYVICGDIPSVPGCNLDGGNATDFIQNGAPDGIGLLLSGTLVDAVSYEGNTGAPYTEGSGVGLIDSGANIGEGISRCPDGTDTNVNNVDFLTRLNTAGARNACPGDDAPPAVASSFPTDGASVGVASNLTVTFNEPVTVTDPWFTLTCNTLDKAATYSGDGTTFTIDPTEDFADGDVCSLTVLAAQVRDQDGIDPPDNMELNFTVGFTAQDVCLQTFTPIYAIQGSGPSAAITGPVTTQGVVVGAFDDPTGIGGFYVQDPVGDGDPATSDGIFVYTANNNSVSVGDVVRVSANAAERFTQTALTGATPTTPIPAGAILECGSGATVAPTEVTMPFASTTFPERYEGMLVTFPQSLVISEYFNFDRFGEIVLALPLAGEDRPYTGTAKDAPGAPANARTAANLVRRITLDDNNASQNPPILRHPNGEPFSLTNRFRGGDTVANATGVLGFDFSLYRIFPTAPADYTPKNLRPEAPAPVGGTIRAAAMNTLNFFLTLDTTANDNGPGPCGGNQNLDCRGADADQPDEFPRQRTKLLQALAGLDADIIGLNEIENTPGVEPLLDPQRGIVAGLNDLGVGPYAAIDTGVIGGDAIRVGLIYRSDVVTPVGTYKILDSSVDPRFIDTRNRPVLAQAFEVRATGARFTVAVNHLKSKGSACTGATAPPLDDPDQLDGQGNCPMTRKLAAEALVDWLATDPTGSGDRDYLILGDLNSYAREDPITAIRNGADDVPGTADDNTNLIAKYVGADAYSYVFDGQSGYLDHALASPTLVGQVTGATEWHINGDEPDILDYDTSFKPDAGDVLYEPNQYRTSDHDPVIVGLNPLNYQFTGFQSPVDNPPVVNGVKLGQSIPVKFQLSGDLGLGVLFGTPTATSQDCDASGGLPDPLETTATAGASGLQYDPTTNTYTYVWKTDKTWNPGCRTFEITFDDGTYRRALFQFTK
ncbi:MAG TPA: ExeM/NucH family extracellular endonuclease [Candidatus Limnocylindrales bacterium]|nr:ExeM/NucH family extracellular endonuclease [Candidatus Limnocylindrales bacterium]